MGVTVPMGKCECPTTRIAFEIDSEKLELRLPLHKLARLCEGLAVSVIEYYYVDEFCIWSSFTQYVMYDAFITLCYCSVLTMHWLGFVTFVDLLSSVMYSLFPRPLPVIQCCTQSATLKNWEWPGEKAKLCTIVIM